MLYPICSLAIFLPLCWRIYWPAADGLDVTGHQIGRDFINVWAGPQLAFGGRLDALLDLQGYHAAIGELFGHPLPFHNWGYPLFTLPAFWPLAELPYFVALAMWTFGLFAIFAGVVLSQIERSERPWTLLVLMLAPACLINAVGGQNGFVSAALLLGGVLWLDRRPTAAGVLFGLLAFKPHLGLVLPFALLALGATVMLLVGGSIALFGIEPWHRYFEVTGAYQVLLLEKFHGFYTTMMASVFAGARTFGLPYEAAMTIQIALAVPVLIAACLAVRRTTDPCRRALVLASAAPLLTPYAFNYDLTALSAALVWMLAGRLSWPAAWRPLAFLAYISPVAMMPLQAQGVGLMPPVLAAVFLVSLHEAGLGRGRRAQAPQVAPLRNRQEAAA